jgi:UDP-N-acetylglucosamine 2-epimerase
VVAGVESQDVLAGIAEMLERKMSQENPFGDGETGKRIVDILVASID